MAVKRDAEPGPPIAPGIRYGRLVAVAFVERDRHGKARWRFQCDCGSDIVRLEHGPRSGQSKSCGCYRRDLHVTHGQSYRREWHIWQGMKQRCENRDAKGYKNYGGRGIQVCDRWQSFENFFSDMGPRPTRGHTIERRNNNADYDPDNCYWTTNAEQQRNKRTNRWVTYDGELMLLVDACAKAGLRGATVSGRLRLGWSVERSLTTPLRVRS